MSRIIFPAIIMAALFLSACGKKGQTGKCEIPNTAVGEARIGGAFSLVDHNGVPVTEQTYRGKPVLTYFGFAYCPDICPTSLQQMSAALDAAGPVADQFQRLFFSVDPERDTPESLAQYVTNAGFPENLVGLTGTQEQVEAVKKTFAIYSAKAADDGSSGDYMVDHTSIIYLFDKDGKFVDLFSHSDSPEKIARRLTCFIETGA